MAPNNITVDLWLDQWIAEKAEDLEETTINSYMATLDRVRGKLGHIRLQALAEDDVRAWMEWGPREGRVRSGRAGAGLGVISVEMSLARLKDALNRAVKRHLVAENAAQDVTIPRKTRKAERLTRTVVPPWTETEVHSFVLGVRDDRLRAPLLLSLMGLRPAEVCGLRWADVDLDKGTLSITNTRTLMGNRTVVEKSAKSAAGERLLPLPALVSDALKHFAAVQSAEELAAGAAYESSGHVLVDELGRALNGKYLRERAYKIMARNQLRRVRLYDARASCLTYLANNGVPDHLLARWAGHSSVKTTKQWYVKPDVEDLRPAAAAWGGLAGVPTPSPDENVRCGSVSG
ncbi:tyrosine-type recombinase/integrase [Streptomyces justiciae]|uniref:Tyrosine-type recombinase/integrase n=1 Tax=Streptomyces justiciae TaxID=2780140 RepID=A0ABU3LLN2_9ACTN|nr:tyrosine-type recombinase/integrase [Streptomyces justiciae]MDT7840155.1 tyrosine-type recombinase/integrase [Streptomyces justiciae]